MFRCRGFSGGMRGSRVGSGSTRASYGRAFDREIGHGTTTIAAGHPGVRLSSPPQSESSCRTLPHRGPANAFLSSRSSRCHARVSGGVGEIEVAHVGHLCNLSQRLVSGRNPLEMAGSGEVTHWGTMSSSGDGSFEHGNRGASWPGTRLPCLLRPFGLTWRPLIEPGFSPQSPAAR